MTSRERIFAAINHEETDRIPIDLGGSNATTILAEAYHNLLKYLNIDKPIIAADSMQFYVYVDEEVMDRFQCDAVPCYPKHDLLGNDRDVPLMDWVHPRGTPIKITSAFKPDKKEDGSYEYIIGDSVFRLPDRGYYFDQVKAPFAWVETVKDVEKIEIPAYSEEELAYFKKTAEKLRAESDRFIICDIYGGWCDIAGPWLGNEKYYMDIAANPTMVYALFELMTDAWIRKIDQVAEYLGDLIDAIPMYNDLGHNGGGLYRNETVRDIVLPHVRRFIDHVEKVSNYHIIIHSCGSVYQYIPDMIDAGVKILNPVQLGAKDMEPEKLKREFGKDLVFWGGAIDPQHTLAFGTPEQVEEEAKQNIKAFMKGGGYIFNNPHNIQANVKPENIVALYDAAVKYGEY